ncbi:MAG: serine hydrolase [Gemmatimonadota bacterium]
MNMRLRGATFALIGIAIAGHRATGQTVAGNPRVQSALQVARTWLDAEQGYHRIPGLSAAIVADQELVWSGGFGYADLARRDPATPATIYSICSISKLFTSLAVLQLRDQGKLRLDDPVAKHLSWFNIKRTFPESPEITIEGLLTHASGLPRESAHGYWSADWVFPTRDEIISKLGSQETLYPAEKYWQYSNLGLTLAGEIVAAASGKPYADYVKANLLSPLGLTSTTPEIPADERGRRLAVGYGPWKREGERTALPVFQVRGIAPAAGYASTALDLSKFAMWQFRLLKNGGTEILSANTLREMRRVHFVDPDFNVMWGLGFAVERNDNKTFVGHGGSCPGYQTDLLMRDEDRIGVVVMTNAIDAVPAEMAQRVYQLVAPAIIAARTDSTPKPFDPSLTAYLGSYDNPWGGETAVVPWEGGLALLYLPTPNPLRALTKLRKVGEHTFRRVRSDETLGEAFVFEMGPDGKPAKLVVNNNASPRLR